MKIENAKLSQYNEVKQFLEDAYGSSRDSFPQRWPQFWKEEYTDFRNVFLIRENNKIVSLVRVFPLEFQLKGMTIKSAGIGNVATLYPHRGKGYMSKLLNEVLIQIKKDKFPISILWGDRHRYGFFGYEKCGSCVKLSVNARGIKKLGIKPAEAERFFGDKIILEKIINLYNANSYRRERTIKDFETIYCKRGVATYYITENQGFAYVTLPSTEVSGGGALYEFGGNPELLLGLLQTLSVRFGQNSFVFTYPNLTEIPDIILNSASSWSAHNMCDLKIIDLKETLRLFINRSDICFPEGEEITFTIKDKESVTVYKTDGTVYVEGEKEKNEIILSEQDMVRLLFGLTFWAPNNIDTPTKRLLQRFLPFSFFVWPTDTV
jgi:predicted N-acetyltransferase YhbS